MNCKHCRRPIQICYDGNCGGWHPPGRAPVEPCTGWLHHDLFHGCPDGQHQARPAATDIVSTP